MMVMQGGLLLLILGRGSSGCNAQTGVDGICRFYLTFTDTGDQQHGNGLHLIMVMMLLLLYRIRKECTRFLPHYSSWWINDVSLMEDTDGNSSP